MMTAGLSKPACCKSKEKEKGKRKNSRLHFFLFPLHFFLQGDCPMSRSALFLAALALFVSACSKDAPPTVSSTTSKPGKKDSASTTSKEYEVRLHIPAKAGERREMQLIHTRSMKVVGKGDKKDNVSHSDGDQIFFTGTIKTLAVNERGAQTKAQIIVDRFILKGNEAPPLTVLEAGTSIMAEAVANATHFQREGEGGELGKLAEVLLPKFFALHEQAAGPTLADVFATDQRHKFGASWPINKEAGAKVIKRMSTDMDADQVTGSAKLVRVVHINGVECLEVQFTLAITQPNAPMPPPGLKGVSSSWKRTSTEAWPSNYATGPLRQVTQLEVQAKFEGVPGTLQDGVSVEVKSTETTDAKVKYLGP
jgi:hypothetical protein